MSGRILFETALVARELFYRRRLESAPAHEQLPLFARVLALRTAIRRPRAELPLILFLSLRPYGLEVLNRLP